MTIAQIFVAWFDGKLPGQEWCPSPPMVEYALDAYGSPYRPAQ